MYKYTISLEKISKVFRRFQNPGWRALDMLGFRISTKKFDEFVVLNEIDLHIKPGEKVALIGRNGAGKSTLLRVIAGQIQVDRGKVVVNGCVQALMELGIGFHPDFTGIDNILSSLAYQGKTPHEATLLLDEIIDFTELEAFIERPVREYSSGMYARLAFAAATAIKPDILIIDEILGAGDAYFVGKCIQRMKNLTAHGTTVLFVSHDMSAVQLLCERGLWIDQGVIKADGDILSVSKSYLASVRVDEEIRARARNLALNNGSFMSKQAPHNIPKKEENIIPGLEAQILKPEDHYGTGPLKIIAFEFFNQLGVHCYTLVSGEAATALVHYRSDIPVQDPAAVIAIYRPDGTCALQVTSHSQNKKMGLIHNAGKIRVSFDPLLLGPGDYTVSVAFFKTLNMASKYEPEAYDLHDRCYVLKVLPPLGMELEIGIVNQPATWEMIL